MKSIKMNFILISLLIFAQSCSVGQAKDETNINELKTLKMKKLILTQFTDPACTWCWGSEPVVRKLEWQFGDQLELKFVMGGLVKDINQFGGDPRNGVTGTNVKQLMEGVATHWVDASSRHGMPVDISVCPVLFDEENISTYPMNEAYKAAQLQDSTLADVFLRRIREAVTTEGRPANRLEILVELAEETGLNPVRFKRDMEEGNASEAFYDDLMTSRKMGATGFPAFLLTYGEKQLMVKGYRTADQFYDIIADFTQGEIKPLNRPFSEKNGLKFMSNYRNVAPVELQTAFDISRKQADEWLTSQVAAGSLTKHQAGNGFFFSLSPKNPMYCDPVTKECKSN